MAELVEPLDFALRNTRVLVRRVAVAGYRHEPIPASYAALLRELADCSDAVAEELAAGRLPSAVRDRLVALGRETSHARAGARPVRRGGARAGRARSSPTCWPSAGMDPLVATDQIPPLPD